MNFLAIYACYTFFYCFDNVLLVFVMFFVKIYAFIRVKVGWLRSSPCNSFDKFQVWLVLTYFYCFIKSVFINLFCTYSERKLQLHLSLFEEKKIIIFAYFFLYLIHNMQMLRYKVDTSALSFLSFLYKANHPYVSLT